MAQKITRRVTEIDLLRTVAIVMMVAYHTAYDLRFFHGFDINLFGPAWETLRITTVILFLLVAGIASHFSSKPAKRAGTVLLAAAAVSLATYLYDADTFIYFGILHCIGLGLLVLIPLRKLKELTIPIGFVITLLPAPAAPLATLDYYPLLPWAGYMLIGAGVGHYAYIRHSFSAFQHFNISKFITLPGKHALLIYLIHQPILLIVLRFIL